MNPLLPLGTTFPDEDGRIWVYVGFRVTTVGTKDHHFVRCLKGTAHISTPLYQYNASNLETILKRFPALKKVMLDAPALLFIPLQEDLEPHIYELCRSLMNGAGWDRPRKVIGTETLFLESCVGWGEDLPLIHVGWSGNGSVKYEPNRYVVWRTDNLPSEFVDQDDAIKKLVELWGKL